jgi:tRNA-2-methylthio-N6-dimethylallyladenosine synthase
MHTAFPNVELFFRINDTGFLPIMMRALGYEVSGDVELINEYTSIVPSDANMLMKNATKTAYIPISTGCSQFCAYCIVPYSRGLEKHRPFDDIMTEVHAHLANGAEEIVLLGQIVNKHPEFANILRAVSDLPQVVRLRYTSPYPTYFSDEIFALHNERVNICPHIHIPLQSGSSKVLKKMFRGYNKEQFQECITKIRALTRPISLTSDIIVGFTDENEEDFLESLELAEQSRFDMVYIGIYSPRPGTYGAKNYEDNVPMSVKKERWTRLNDILIATSAKNNEEEIGTIRTMIVNQIQDRAIIGYTENMKNVVIERISEVGMEFLPSADLQTGQFLKVKIVRTEAFKLFGEIVE